MQGITEGIERLHAKHGSGKQLDGGCAAFPGRDGFGGGRGARDEGNAGVPGEVQQFVFGMGGDQKRARPGLSPDDTGARPPGCVRTGHRVAAPIRV